MSSSSYNYRSSSPGRRAIYANTYGRHSDINASELRDPYISPRISADRVMPVDPTQTYARDGRTSERLGDRLYETHTRPRRSTLNEASRPSQLVINTAAAPSRNSPSSSIARPTSPLTRSAKEPYDSHGKSSVRRIYTIGDNQTQLYEHSDVAPRKSRSHHQSVDHGSSSHHHRRSSVDRNGFPVAAGPKASNEYHSGIPSSSREVGPQYSYTNPAAMFNETEPIARRRRQGSVDGRPRPMSMVIDSPRHSQRDLGPPSSRALDRYNEGVTRSNSSRHHHRQFLRGLHDDPGYNSQDDYGDRTRVVRRADTVPATMISDYDHLRQHSPMHPVPIINDRAHEQYTASPTVARDTYPRPTFDKVYTSDPRYDDRREPRAYDRTQQPRYKDASVERRGFGLRPASTDRHGGRQSNESFERRGQYTDVGAPLYLDSRDRPQQPDVTRSSQQDIVPFREDERDKLERDRPRDDYKEDPRRREKESYRASRDDYETRERGLHRPGEHIEKHRDYDRDHEPKDRERERDKRHDSSRYDDPMDSKLGGILPAAMAGGLGAAAVYGSDAVASKKKDKNREHSPSTDDDYDERQRERERDRDRDRNRDRDRDRRRHRDSETIKNVPAPDSRPPYPSEGVESAIRPAERGAPPPQQPPQQTAAATNDADEEYRRRLLQFQQETNRTRTDAGPSAQKPSQDGQRESTYTRRDRDDRDYDRGLQTEYHHSPRDERRTVSDGMERSLVIANTGTDRLVSSGSSEGINDTTEKKQNRVRIVEPPSENENKPKGILKKPKEQFPEDPNPLREGVAPLKDKQQSKEIPKGACWTKVSRQLVNPEALRESGERFEEREGCVIVLRVLQKEDIFVLAEKTREIRNRRDRRRERDDERSARRQARHEEDEYDESSSDNEFSDRRRAPRMLEPAPTAPTSGVPPTTSAPQAAVSVAAPPPPLQQQSGPRTDDYGRDRDRDRRDRDRDRDRERDRPDRIRDRD